MVPPLGATCACPVVIGERWQLHRQGTAGDGNNNNANDDNDKEWNKIQTYNS